MPKATAAERKAKQRANEAAKGIGRLEIKLSVLEQIMLDELNQRFGDKRGHGQGEDYDSNETITTLIAMAHSQMSKLGRCGKCKDALPAGCKGLFKGDSQCEKRYLHQTDLNLVPACSSN